jgi:hypothetical protein
LTSGAAPAALTGTRNETGQIVGADELFGDRSKPPLVPMNSDQVWMFDAVRAVNGRDRGALVVSWLVGLGFLAIAIAAASTALYILSGVMLFFVTWWTVGKVRAAREDAAIQRYADSRPDDALDSP